MEIENPTRLKLFLSEFNFQLQHILVHVFACPLIFHW